MLFRADDNDATLALADDRVADGGVYRVAAPMVLSRRPSLVERYDHWREMLGNRLHRADLTPDLAEEIGTRRWWRGLATMPGLAALALSGWPDFAPVAAAPAMDINEGARDEFRSQMILPLALGADSGRRMGASDKVQALAAAPERPRLDFVATLTQGDSFERMLRRAGVSRDEAEGVAQRIGNQVALTEIEPGTKVDITLGRRPQPGAPRALDALSFRARFDLRVEAVRGSAGQLAVRAIPIKVDTTPLRIRAKVGDSLYRAARAAGAPSSAVQQFLKVLNENVDLDSAIAAGDTFDMVIEYKRAETGEAEAGKLLFAGLERDGKPRAQLMRWGKDGRFYEASGVGEQRSGLVAPVNGPVGSRYGMRRHPILGYRRMHSGLDFRAGSGTPIRAVTDGRVSYAGRKGGYGNYVRLEHGGGLGTGYAHMSRIAVSSGARVSRGQVIGYVGSTGLSTGPHLHYEMYRGSRKVDPSSVQFVTRAQLSGRELANFRSQLSGLLQIDPGAALRTMTPSKAVEEAPAREIDRLNAPRTVG